VFFLFIYLHALWQISVFVGCGVALAQAVSAMVVCPVVLLTLNPARVDPN